MSIYYCSNNRVFPLENWDDKDKSKDHLRAVSNSEITSIPNEVKAYRVVVGRSPSKNPDPHDSAVARLHRRYIFPLPPSYMKRGYPQEFTLLTLLCPKLQSPVSTTKMKYWGTLTCLYGTLNSTQIPILEKAISAQQRGFLVEAEQIILHHLAPVERHPVIAIALADVYDHQGLAWRRAKVLHTTLLNYGAWSQDAVGNERLLLKILHADATIRSDGLMRTSLDNMLHEKRILDNFSMLTATEVEVSTMSSVFEID